MTTDDVDYDDDDGGDDGDVCVARKACVCSAGCFRARVRGVKNSVRFASQCDVGHLCVPVCNVPWTMCVVLFASPLASAVLCPGRQGSPCACGSLRRLRGASVRAGTPPGQRCRCMSASVLPRMCLRSFLSTPPMMPSARPWRPCRLCRRARPCSCGRRQRRSAWRPSSVTRPCGTLSRTRCGVGST